jgi:hypothetical protein
MLIDLARYSGRKASAGAVKVIKTILDEIIIKPKLLPHINDTRRHNSTSARQIRDSDFEDILIQAPVLSKITLGRDGLHIKRARKR